MAVPSIILLLSAILSLLFLIPSPSVANEGNILITGDILPTDGELSVPGAAFVIQNDCNLVLYNRWNGFQSDTSGRGTNCSLTLSEYGQLIIKKGDGNIVWTSPYTKGAKGEYAVILQPDGHVGIYGPSLWSTPLLSSQSAVPKAYVKKFDGEPEVPNLLFSSEQLDENSKLGSRDYSLAVVEGCSLQLIKASVGVIWGSPSNTAGRKCFARLNFHGQLALVDDNYHVLWESNPAALEGIYVLAMKINGQASIYGRRFWSTAPTA